MSTRRSRPAVRAAARRRLPSAWSYGPPPSATHSETQCSLLVCPSPTAAMSTAISASVWAGMPVAAPCPTSS